MQRLLLIGSLCVMTACTDEQPSPGLTPIVATSPNERAFSVQEFQATVDSISSTLEGLYTIGFPAKPRIPSYRITGVADLGLPTSWLDQQDLGNGLFQFKKSIMNSNQEYDSTLLVNPDNGYVERTDTLKASDRFPLGVYATKGISKSRVSAPTVLGELTTTYTSSDGKTSHVLKTSTDFDSRTLPPWRWTMSGQLPDGRSVDLRGQLINTTYHYEASGSISVGSAWTVVIDYVDYVIGNFKDPDTGETHYRSLRHLGLDTGSGSTLVLDFLVEGYPGAPTSFRSLKGLVKANDGTLLARFDSGTATGAVIPDAIALTRDGETLGSLKTRFLELVDKGLGSLRDNDTRVYQ